MKTTITVEEDVWNELKRRRTLGETYNDVLRKLLNINQPKKEEPCA